MRLLPAVIVFAVPMAFAPRLLFYYDVTPKSVALLAGAALVLLWAAWKPQTSLSLMTSRFGRWNAGLVAAFCFLTIAAALLSPVVSLPGGRALVWFGSSWRRWGAVEQIATVLGAFLAAGIAGQSDRHRAAVLRAVCAAGVPAGIYGIAQYFGVDPLLSPAAYLVGEGSYQIVRPPGPLGHSDYFAAFLLWPVFAGTALSNREACRFDRWLGGAAVSTGIVAIVLAGSRGAWLGLAAGAMVSLWLWRPRLRSVGASLAVFVTLAAAFYVSPAGARLRARAFWISEDRAGGARLLLWRDSVRMASARPFTGFGPEAFEAEFPQYQSAELARAYPDFYHESPHNIFLDALNSQGPAGVVLLAGWIVLGMLAGLRGPPETRPVAIALLSALAGSTVAQQFIVFVVPTAFTFYLGVSLLAGLAPAPSLRVSMPLRAAIAMGAVLVCGFFAFAGFRLAQADWALGRAQRLLDSGESKVAAALWESRRASGSAAIARDWGVTADLYFSRRWAAAASAAQDPLDKIRLSALAFESARNATLSPEQQQNAWYNFAMLAAAVNDPGAVESSLRAAIAAGPRWFKPHWTLARLLYATGRKDEARQEAEVALDLDGHKDPEVIATVSEIVRSLDSRR